MDFFVFSFSNSFFRDFFISSFFLSGSFFSNNFFSNGFISGRFFFRNISSSSFFSIFLWENLIKAIFFTTFSFILGFNYRWHDLVTWRYTFSSGGHEIKSDILCTTLRTERSFSWTWNFVLNEFMSTFWFHNLFIVIFGDGVTDGVVFIFFSLNSSNNHVLFNLFLSF